MIDLKTAIFVVIICISIEAEDYPYVCSREDEVDRYEDIIYECELRKWTSLPEPDVWSFTKCCFKLEKDCVHNKLIRSMCKVNEALFAEEVRQRYEQLINECKNHSIEVNDEVCGQQSNTAVTDDKCKPWIPCALKDQIPTAPPTRPTTTTTTTSTTTTTLSTTTVTESQGPPTTTPKKKTDINDSQKQNNCSVTSTTLLAIIVVLFNSVFI